MTTTDKSRADALIDERIEDAIYRHIPPKIALENAKALYAMAVELLVASPVEQFAAAPIVSAPASDARECLMDVVSHHHDFVTACKSIKGELHACGAHDSAAYWQKQIDVLDRMKAQAERALATSANETGAEGAQKEAVMLLLQARDELCLIEWEGEDPPERIHTLFDKIEAFVTRSPAMAAEALAEEHSTIECQAHSGPDCTECGGTGVWSGKADERAASWHCEDPVQKCRAQCDSCAKQARAALKAIVDERAECIAWANANGFTKYHESMCAAWEERARRAAQQLSAEIRELKVKLGSYEREREDQTRYLAAQSEEIADLKYQLAHADARVWLTATVIQKCIDSCAAEYLEDVTGHPEDAAYCQGITDCIDALNRLKTADWSVILAAHSGQSEPRASKCDGSGAVSVSVDDWSECLVCRGAGCQPESHKWDEDGERCERCGDKDWMPDSVCRGRQPEPRAEVMPLKVERHSDMSVLVVFNSCRQASVFEREIAVRIQGVES